jgi:hypothetical protein
MKTAIAVVLFVTLFVAVSYHFLKVQNRAALVHIKVAGPTVITLPNQEMTIEIRSVGDTVLIQSDFNSKGNFTKIDGRTGLLLKQGECRHIEGNGSSWKSTPCKAKQVAKP